MTFPLPGGATFLRANHLAPYVDQDPAHQSGLTGLTGITQLLTAIAGRNQAHVDIIGGPSDSIFYGRGPTTFSGSPAQQANRAIRAAYPTTANGSSGGLGFISLQNSDPLGTYTWPIVQASGAAPGQYDLGPVRYCTSMTAACTFTFTAPAGTTSVRIMSYDAPSAGVFSYQVGSGAVTQVSNAGTEVEVLTPTIALTSGQVLTISWVSGNPGVDGILHYAGDENSGITFHNCGRSGWCAGVESGIGWNQPESIAGLNWAQCFSNGFPDPAGMLIMLGANDSNATAGNRTAAQFQSDLGGLIATIRGAATPLATIPLLMGIEYAGPGPWVDPGGWAAYAAADRAAAAAVVNTKVIDLSYRMPPYSSDWLNSELYVPNGSAGGHPTNLGAALIGEIIAAGVRIA